MNVPNPPTEQPKLVTEREAARILGLSVQTLRNDRATKRRIPYIKVLDRAVRYLDEDLRNIIETGRVAGRGA